MGRLLMYVPKHAISKQLSQAFHFVGIETHQVTSSACESGPYFDDLRGRERGKAQTRQTAFPVHKILPIDMQLSENVTGAYRS